MKSLLTLTSILSCFFLFSIHIEAQKTIGKNSTISTTNTNTVSNISSFSWVGEFEYTDDASGTTYDLVVEDEGGQHIATLDIQGNTQLDLDGHIRCKVKTGSNYIEFYYISHSPYHSNLSHAPAAGSLLLKLVRTTDGLFTKWNDVRPPNFDQSTNGEIFFKKSR